nr:MULTISPECIES: metallophosphoesterase family protein [unclassified Rhizobium]
MAGNGMQESQRRREFRDIAGVPTYAIGDIHGRYDLLTAIEALITADAAQFPGRKLMITLGDYIDRGPDSARVVSHLMAPAPEGFDRICLTGNHETAMLAYVDGEITLTQWLAMGAEATLLSYGLDSNHLARQYPSPKKLDDFIRASLPADHIAFLRDLPIMLDTPSVLFVHAGIDPHLSIADQTDQDLVFIRGRFLKSRTPLPKLVVHGHTQVKSPEARGRRLNLDTGAFHSGSLSVARFYEGTVNVMST